MIDIKLIRENPERFIDAARLKNVDADIPALLEVDAKLMDATREMQDVRTQQNAAGKQIAQLKGEDKAKAIASMGELKARAKELGDLIDELQPQFDELMLRTAQPPAPEVPVGKDDTENVLLRTEGEPPKFDFEPKDHMQLGEALDIIDVPRGVKLAGSRNFILKGDGARLHQAILRLAVDQMVAKGYTLMTVPVLVNESVMYGTGYFPVGRDQAYLAERDDMSLVGTAEVPVTAYHSEEILDEADLPRKYVRDEHVLPPRGRGGRQGHLRALPRALLRQGRAGDPLPQRRGGEHPLPPGDPRQRRGRAQGAGAAVPRGERLHGRPRPGAGAEIRHRDVDAQPGRLRRDALGQPVLRVPGPPAEHAVPRRRRHGAVRATR